MKFKEKSEFDIILKLEDVEGNSLRVEDTFGLKLYIWTANRLNHLVFSKRDVNTKGKFDKITVPNFFMEALESGVVSYTYDYSIYDKETKEVIVYDKVKEIYTDIVWRNSNFHQIPANPVNYKTLEYLRDLIEKNNLEVDEKTANIEEIAAKAEELETKAEELETKAEELEARAEEVEKELQDNIDKEEARAEAAEADLNQKIIDEHNLSVSGDDALKVLIEALQDKLIYFDDHFVCKSNDTDGYLNWDKDAGVYFNDSHYGDAWTDAAGTDSIPLCFAVTVNGTTYQYCIDMKTGYAYYRYGDVGEGSLADINWSPVFNWNLYLTKEEANELYQPKGDYATNESLESLKEEVESQIEEIKEDSLTEIETTIENIQTTITENTESITSLQESVETLEKSVETLQESKQDKLSAGDNITISEDNVISVDLSEYAKTEDVESKVDEVYNILETEINTKQDAFVTDIKGDDVLTLEGDIANGVLTITGSVDTYSKSDIDDKISEVVSDEKSDLNSYYTKEETDKTFATKEEIPTKVSAFTNDAGYVVDSDLTATLDNYATNSSVDDAVSTLEGEISKKQDQLTAGTGISIENNVVTCTLDPEIFVVVSALPSQPESENINKIHCVPDPESTEADNIFIEYLWVNEAWEIIGKFQPEVDLSDYQKTADADAKYATIADTYTKEEVEDKIAQVEAGEETALEDYLKKTEAASTYQPIGDYATVTELNTKQDTLTPGTNITIANNVISAEVPTKVSELTNDTGYITDAALSDYAKTSDIPTKVSELTNDSNYVDSTTLNTTLENYAKTTDIPTVPTNVSAFNNDSGYITEAALDGYAKESDIPTKTSELTNDSDYTTTSYVDSVKSEIEAEIPTVPTNVSAFTNDSGYITSSALDGYAKESDIPTKTSELSNDSGFITSSALEGYAKTSDIPTNVSELTNDSGYITDSALSDYVTSSTLSNELSGYAKTSDIPTKTSDLTNDSGFITSSDVPTNVSAFTNDAGYITISDVPTKVSELTNDSGYITDDALNGYATESWVKNQGYLTEHQDLSDYAKTEYVDKEVKDCVKSTDIGTIVTCTQAEFDSLTPEDGVVYLIIE